MGKATAKDIKQIQNAILALLRHRPPGQTTSARELILTTAELTGQPKVRIVGYLIAKGVIPEDYLDRIQAEAE